MPRGLAHWADTHGRFDNFPAYGLVGLPFFLITPGFLRQLAMLAVLILFVVILELAQLSIPSRHCDAWDVLWGGLGLLTAWSLCSGLKFVTARIMAGFNLRSNPATAPTP